MSNWHVSLNSCMMFTLQHSVLSSTFCASPHVWGNTVIMAHLSLLIKELEQRNYIFSFGITFVFALTTL
jgi:hypothetical protein